MYKNLGIFHKTSNQKGITLVALVITIVILIILAAVAINYAFGNNGLVKYAEEARDKSANSTIAEAIENKTKYADTTPIKDDLDNTVYIPGGFHLAEDSSTKVEGGIVIEDDSGNQFVWIPTGEYNVTEEVEKITEPDVQDGKLTNELSRRKWGTKNVVQEPTTVNGDNVIGSYFYGEGDSRSCTIVDGVNSIEAFLSSAKPVSEGGNGGFYIGRYEQGEGNVCKAGVVPYVNITRDEAKNQAEAMYSGKTEIKATSELISSYAWDTALNFICQTNSAGYTLATTTDSKYGNIGTGSSGKTNTGEYGADKYSNICDFLGNRWEWTTEYSSRSYNPCVLRGGVYGFSLSYATYRVDYHTSGSTDRLDVGFRLQLYVM